jgi:pimeloyl-ACP methyl ester carboxylesterase
MRTLVFLHGWGTSGAIWRRQGTAFAGDLRVLTPTIPAWDAHWLAGYLRDLALKDCLLVGWSLGGMLLLEALASLAEKPAGLALVAVAATFCRRPDHPWGPEAAQVRAMRRALASDSRQVLREFARQCLAPGEEAFGEEAAACFDPENPVAHLSQGLDYLQKRDLRPLLPGVSSRVAIIQGEGDGIVPPGQGRFLQRQIPGARLFLMPAAGHLPFVTQAGAFNQILREFLREAEL